MKKKLLLAGTLAVACLSIGVFAAGCSGDGGTGTHHAATAPTCTTTGNVEYWEKDGKNYADEACTRELASIEVSVNPAAHEVTGNWVTDSVNNRHYKVCAHDSSHRAVEEPCTPATEWTVKKAADYRGDGTVVKKCTGCGQELESRKVMWHGRVAATCSNAGSLEHYTLEGDGNMYSDAACNVVLTDASVELDATAHRWKLDYVSKNGKHWLECEYNSEHRTVAEDCRPATIPTYDSDETMHYVVCKDCGSHIGRGVTHKSGELWTARVEAEVGQNGIIIKKCVNCGYVTETKTVIYHAAVAPTCNSAGTVAYYTVSGDDEVYSDPACNNMIRTIAGEPATGAHVWEWVVDRPATTTSAGSKHEICVNCGATQSLNTEIPMLTADSGSVKVNGITYAKPSEADGRGGVTYDATAGVYVVEVSATSGRELAITVTDRSVNVIVTGAATLSSITIDATINDPSVSVTFSGEPLTVSGSIVSKGVNLVLLGNVTVAGGVYANVLTVGDAANTVNPTVTIKRNLTNDIEGYGKKAVNYNFLSGTTLVINDTEDDVAAGIEIRDENNGSAGSKINIAEHAKVIVNGFYGGIHSERTGNASMSVAGSLQIATVKLAIDIDWSAPAEERDPLIAANNLANSAIKNFAITVLGGTLEFDAANTGVVNGSLSLFAGTVNTGSDGSGFRSVKIDVYGGTMNLYSEQGDGKSVVSNGKLTIDGGTVNSYGKYIGNDTVVNGGNLNARSSGSDWNIFVSGTVELNAGRAVFLKNDSGGAAFWDNCAVTVKDGCEVYLKNFARITHAGATLTIERKKVKCENLSELNAGDHNAKDCGVVVAAGTTPDFTVPVKPTIPTI